MINVLVGCKRSASDPAKPWIPKGETEPKEFDNVKLTVLEMDYLGRGLVVPSGKTPGVVTVKTAVFCDAVGLTIEEIEDCFDTFLFGKEVNVHYERRRDEFVATAVDILDSKYLEFTPCALEDFQKAKDRYVKK